MAERLTGSGRRAYGVGVTAGRDGGRAAGMAARLLAALAFVLVAVAVALPLLSGYGYLDELTATPEVAVAVSFSVTGALLVGSVAARRIGWLLLAIGLTSAAYTSSVSWTAYVLRGDAEAALPTGADLALVTAWVSTWAWFPGWMLVSTVLPQVVPYGRPLPGRLWRIPLWAAGVFLALGVLGFATAPGELGIFTGIDNPVGSSVSARVFDPLGAVLDVGVLGLVLLSIAAVVIRVVRADGVERRQVGWFGYAVVMTIVLILVAPSAWANMFVLLIPAGIAVAALRYRLWDLDLLVNRTLVAVLLLGGAALMYVALVAWVGALFGTSEGIVPFVAAFAVALAFHPARLRLQRFVDRLFHGRRGDPYALLQDLDRTLREADSPREALSAATALVRDGLRLPGVALVVPLPDSLEVREQAGNLPDRPVSMSLELHGEAVGTLLVAPRPGRAGSATSDTADEPGLPDADRRVLLALTGPLASAAYALRLSGDLERSHRALLAAREEERRRLRRDLHDGLGPSLAGIVMGLDVVRSSLGRGDTARADDLVGTVTGQARAAVDDVRRLVNGLRPPALDDLGLVGALRALLPSAMPGDEDPRGGQEYGAGAASPTIDITTDGVLGALPAAVEVAAYRIAAEAVTNAVRHAGATSVRVRLASTSDTLTVTVRDDGAGIGPDAVLGVGLGSMRERAAELGGRCTVRSDGHGTEVVAVLPLSVDDAAPRNEPVTTAEAPGALPPPDDSAGRAAPNQVALTPTAPVEEPA